MLLRYDNTFPPLYRSLSPPSHRTGTPTGSLSSSDRWWRSYGYVLSIFESPELHALGRRRRCRAVCRACQSRSCIARLSHTSEFDDPQSQTASAMPISSRDSLTNWSDAGGNALSRDPSSTNLTFRSVARPSSRSATTRRASPRSATRRRRRRRRSLTSATSWHHDCSQRLALRHASAPQQRDESHHAVSARDAAQERDEVTRSHTSPQARRPPLRRRRRPLRCTSAVAHSPPAPRTVAVGLRWPPRRMLPCVVDVCCCCRCCCHPLRCSGGDRSLRRHRWAETSSATTAAGSSTSPLDDELQIIIVRSSLGAAQPTSELAVASSRPNAHRLDCGAHTRAAESALRQPRPRRARCRRAHCSHARDARASKFCRLPTSRRTGRVEQVASAPPPPPPPPPPPRVGALVGRQLGPLGAAGHQDVHRRCVGPLGWLAHRHDAGGGSGGGNGGGGGGGGGGGLRTSSASISRRRVRTGRRRHARRDSIATAGGGDHLSLEPASRRSASAGTRGSLRRARSWTTTSWRFRRSF
jgi:hypothetical protein